MNKIKINILKNKKINLRNLKSTNILLESDGTIKLSDYGLYSMKRCEIEDIKFEDELKKMNIILQYYNLINI